ncbi:MAG: hypothetical protein K2P94_16160 [Rhodospirillaceae bacterium]|nr:hypothetical protein [Rhodospirillaceae bacterium]
MDKSSPLTTTAPLPVPPPAPARGAHAPEVGAEDFRAMLATQGVKAPAGAIPTAAEAQIEAAQIAAKAHVNIGVARQPVLTGRQPQPTAIVAPAPGRFMPLREGPAAARAFTAPAPTGAANTLAGLRATTKFAPGPTGPLSPMKPTAKTAAAPPSAPHVPMTQTAPPAVPPHAVDAYTYGLRAMQQGLDKYDAMSKTDKKP